VTAVLAAIGPVASGLRSPSQAGNSDQPGEPHRTGARWWAGAGGAERARRDQGVGGAGPASSPGARWWRSAACPTIWVVLQWAETGYAIANAHPCVLARGGPVTASNADDGGRPRPRAHDRGERRNVGRWRSPALPATHCDHGTHLNRRRFIGRPPRPSARRRSGSAGRRPPLRRSWG
jgi:hypothetical protein